MTTKQIISIHKNLEYLQDANFFATQLISQISLQQEAYLFLISFLGGFVEGLWRVCV